MYAVSADDAEHVQEQPRDDEGEGLAAAAIADVVIACVQAIGVWMADAMRTDAFHPREFVVPSLRPAAQRVIGSVVERAPRAGAHLWRMGQQRWGVRMLEGGWLSTSCHRLLRVNDVVDVIEQPAHTASADGAGATVSEDRRQDLPALSAAGCPGAGGPESPAVSARQLAAGFYISNGRSKHVGGFEAPFDS